MQILRVPGLWVPLVNLNGIYILPGIPRLFKQMIECHKDRFCGPTASALELLTNWPEGELAGEFDSALCSMHTHFDILTRWILYIFRSDPETKTKDFDKSFENRRVLTYKKKGSITHPSAGQERVHCCKFQWHLMAHDMVSICVGELKWLTFLALAYAQMWALSKSLYYGAEEGGHAERSVDMQSHWRRSQKSFQGWHWAPTPGPRETRGFLLKSACKVETR